MRVITESVGKFAGVGEISVVVSTSVGGATGQIVINGVGIDVDTAKLIASRITAAVDLAASLAKTADAMGDPALSRKIAAFDEWSKAQTAILDQRRADLDAEAAKLAILPAAVDVKP